MRNLSHSEYALVLERAVQAFLPHLSQNRDLARSKAEQLLNAIDSRASNANEFHLILNGKLASIKVAKREESDHVFWFLSKKAQLQAVLTKLEQRLSDPASADKCPPQTTTVVVLLRSLISLNDQQLISRQADISQVRQFVQQYHQEQKDKPQQQGQKSQGLMHTSSNASIVGGAGVFSNNMVPIAMQQPSSPPTLWAGSAGPAKSAGSEEDIVVSLCDFVDMITLSQLNKKGIYEKVTQLKSRLQSHHNSHRKEWQPSVSTALELLAMYEDTMKASTSTGDEGASVELIKILLKDLVTSEVSRLIQRAREGDSMLRVRASGVLARVQNICGVLTISLDMKGKDSAEDWIVKPSEDMGRDLEAYASCLESVVTDPLPTLFGDTVYMGMNLRL